MGFADELRQSSNSIPEKMWNWVKQDLEKRKYDHSRIYDFDDIRNMGKAFGSRKSAKDLLSKKLIEEGFNVAYDVKVNCIIVKW